MSAKVDLTGQRFGRLVVIEDAGLDKYGSYVWRCRCDCGNEIVVKRSNLQFGHTRSCGCLSRETLQNRHGIPNKKLTLVRLSMKRRCYDKNCKEYKYYGARGIKICEEWLGKKGRENFVAWAIENGYKPGLSIDRIDVNGDYEPGNCRWVTLSEQSKNRRTNLLVEYNGKMMCSQDAAKMSGIKPGTLRQRIHAGWSKERLFSEPDDRRRKKAWAR